MDSYNNTNSGLPSTSTIFNDRFSFETRPNNLENSGHPSTSTNFNGQFPLGTRPNGLDIVQNHHFAAPPTSGSNVGLGQLSIHRPTGTVRRLHFHTYVDVPILANPSAGDLGLLLLSGHHGPINTTVTHEVVRPREALRSAFLNASSSNPPLPSSRPRNFDLNNGPTHFHLPPPPGFEHVTPVLPTNPSSSPVPSCTSASTTRNPGASSSVALALTPTPIPTVYLSDDSDDVPKGIPLVPVPVPFGTPSPPAPTSGAPVPVCTPSPPAPTTSAQQNLGAGGFADGRTRSLPRVRQDDPFRCPLCEEAFTTSQLYANHVRVVHYKNETPEEKEERRARKCNAKMAKRRRVHGNDIPPVAAAVAEGGGAGASPEVVHRLPDLFTGESLRDVKRIAREMQAPPAAPVAQVDPEAEDSGGSRDAKGKQVMSSWA